MKKRLFAIIVLVILAFTTFSACAEQNIDFAEKAYIYEQLLGDEPFIIYIEADGTYTYSEGSQNLISYGTWSYRNGILTLHDDDKDNSLSNIDNIIINKFTVESGYLAFIEEGSTNFKYLKISDGDKFYDMSSEKAE